MNAHDQAELAAMLEASGVELVKPIRNGAAIVGYDVVPWASALGRIMGAFGWSARCRITANLERRVTDRRTLQLVRPEPAEQSAHAPEDQADGHRGVTEQETNR